MDNLRLSPASPCGRCVKPSHPGDPMVTATLWLSTPLEVPLKSSRRIKYRSCAVMRNPGVRVSSFLGCCKKIIKKAQIIKKTHSWHKQPTVLELQANKLVHDSWLIRCCLSPQVVNTPGRCKPHMSRRT